MKSLLQELGSFIKALHAGAWSIFKRNWPWWLFLAVGILGTAALIFPHDKTWLAAIQQPKHEAGPHPQDFTTVHAIARQLSSWGDFFKLNIILLVAGLPLAILLKSVRWQRIVLIVFFAALWGGIAVNILRPAIGRPRPSAGLEDGINPMSFSHDYHSFPSGHTTTIFATATSFAIVCPAGAVPATIVAGGVGWSRMQLNRHHPADILGGIGLGVFWGCVFGLAGRRLINQEGTKNTKN